MELNEGQIDHEVRGGTLLNVVFQIIDQSEQSSPLSNHYHCSPFLKSLLDSHLVYLLSYTIVHNVVLNHKVVLSYQVTMVSHKVVLSCNAVLSCEAFFRVPSVVSL